MIGLRRGVVAIKEHQAQWSEMAASIIHTLSEIFGDTAVDIQHIGSTAIRAIMAKPILDIAVGVRSFDGLTNILARLETHNFKQSRNRFSSDLLYVVQDERNVRTAQIHILIYDTAQWRNYIDFRDYMNAFPEKAKLYEQLKIALASECGNVQTAYTDGKKAYMEKTLPDARIWSQMNGKMNIASFEPIDKGWSCDKKYHIALSSGENYLLRVTPHEKSANRENMFHMMRRVADLGVAMCKPLQFGSCIEGTYTLQSWIDGVDAESAIPVMSEARQYAYGLDAGIALKTIHSLPAPDTQEDWAVRFNHKIDRKIVMYAECALKYDQDQPLLAYIGANRHLLENRPQTFQHGDYHIGNMMIDANDALQIIDFDRYDFGDPWEEFNRIVWCAQVSPHFASGMVDGYFGGNIPMEFWQLLALYIATNTLSSLPWAIPFGQAEIDTMRNQAREVLSWYDDMKNPVPTWYIRNLSF